MSYNIFVKGTILEVLTTINSLKRSNTLKIGILFYI